MSVVYKIYRDLYDVCYRHYKMYIKDINIESKAAVFISEILNLKSEFSILLLGFEISLSLGCRPGPYITVK